MVSGETLTNGLAQVLARDRGQPFFIYFLKYILAYYHTIESYIYLSLVLHRFVEINVLHRMAKQKILMHRIKEVLKEKKKSAYWLAQETEISYNSIHGYVNNKVIPSLPNLYKIASALKVSGKDLINF